MPKATWDAVGQFNVSPMTVRFWPETVLQFRADSPAEAQLPISSSSSSSSSSGSSGSSSSSRRRRRRRSSSSSICVVVLLMM